MDIQQRKRANIINKKVICLLAQPSLNISYSLNGNNIPHSKTKNGDMLSRLLDICLEFFLSTV